MKAFQHIFCSSFFLVDETECKNIVTYRLKCFTVRYLIFSHSNKVCTFQYTIAQMSIIISYINDEYYEINWNWNRDVIKVLKKMGNLI